MIKVSLTSVNPEGTIVIRLHKPPLYAATAVLVALLATACGSSTSTTATKGSTGGAAGGAAAGEWPRTIEHTMGSTVIPSQPKRVVALDLSFVNAAILLETPVVGFTQYRAIADELPAYLGESRQKYAAEATSVGPLSQPSLEQIAALKPDLIVSAKVRHEDLYPQLSAIAPTIMTETTGPTWKANITWLASALGKEDVAAAKVGGYEAAAKQVGDAIKVKAGDPKLSVVRFLDGPTRLYTRGSFSGIIFEDAGLSRPASQQDTKSLVAEISEENIAMADGDKIFVTTFDDDKLAGSASRAKFEANPLWAPLQPKVELVDDETWMTSVSVQGAYEVLGDLARIYDVPAPPAA